jgi:hypothetical protein
MIGVKGYVYADIVISGGKLLKYSLIPNKEYPALNALYYPHKKINETRCDPVFIGDMSEWLKAYLLDANTADFYETDVGYCVIRQEAFFTLVIHFDRNGLLHNDHGPALYNDSDYPHYTFAKHGEYTPGKINEYIAEVSLSVCSGKVLPEDFIGTRQEVVELDISNAPDYTGPAYISEHNKVFTVDGEIYATLPKI